MIQDQHSDSGFYVYCDQEHIEGGKLDKLKRKLGKLVTLRKIRKKKVKNAKKHFS